MTDDRARTATQTFLATDIQGSTEMWQRFPDTMPGALERHDQLLESVIGEHGGEVFKNVGDGVFAVFESAPQAVQAAIDAQRRTLDETWGTPEPLRVRMAIHAGEAEQRGGDYFGLAVNRVARILGVGHGGQILLSQSVERLTSDHFPSGTALRDLGLRSLKDLTEPERLFQLVAEGLPEEFPPLNTLDTRPHNLPAQTTPVVGRREEIAAIRDLVLDPERRLITLTGPSGTGKTRLGIQVAAESIDEFQHGVFLVDLAVTREAEQVARTIVSVFDVEVESGADVRSALLDYLREREILLVLDNFEQVIEAANLVSEILRSAPAIKVLVTSQAPLRIRGEHEYPLAPLSTPDPERLPPIQQLDDYDAVVLFTERARAVQPSFQIDQRNAEAVVQIVHQLDGLPLAIELAAARVKLFPPRALVQRINRGFDFLTAGTRDLPDRQRTLRGALLWSYELLSADEQKLFRRTSVFDGGFTIEAAEAVCVDENETLDVFEALASLVDKSLLRTKAGEADEPRFERLRTIRSFGLELLEEEGHAERWKRRHAQYFARFSAKLDLTRGVSPDRRHAFARVDEEYENIRVAMKWALGVGDGALAARIGQALPATWFRLGFREEAQELLRELEGLLDGLEGVDRAHALNLIGRFEQIQGSNAPEIIKKFEHSLELYRAADHKSGAARALMNLGNARSREGSLDEARTLFEEALQLYGERDDAFGMGGALMNLGDTYLAERDVDRADEYFIEARDVAQRGGEDVSFGFANQYLGLVACYRGQLDEAEHHFQISHDVFSQLGARPGIAWGDLYLAHIARERGRLEEAGDAYRQVLALFDELEMAVGVASALIGLAAIEGEHERWEQVAQLVGAADTRMESVAVTQVALAREIRDRLEVSVVGALGADEFERLRLEGRSLSATEAAASTFESPTAR